MPGSIRLFVESSLHPGAAVTLSPGQAHYLAHVMRRGPGDQVVLFNGRDGEWTSRLARLRRDTAECEVEQALRPQMPEPDAWLLFAPLKRDATELVVEKATELGIGEIRPVVTARTNPRALNLERLDAIATEAAEQSERLSVPRIAAPVALFEALRAWPAERRLVAAIERQAADPVRAAGGPCALLVGPEGGLTPAELDVLRRTPFIVPASLGPRILRAETASIAGLALLLSPHGD